MKLDLQEIETFLQVVELGSVSLAAERLGEDRELSRPSRQVGRHVAEGRPVRGGIEVRGALDQADGQGVHPASLPD